MIGVRPRAIQSLNEELQGPDPIALQHVDVPSAPSMWPTMELAGDDETVMLRIVQVGLAAAWSNRQLPLWTSMTASRNASTSSAR